MTPIITHIEYLLQRNDCVILPGFGAFVARRNSAEIDMQKNVITPPERIITFNPSITHDDGMLATSVARRENVKYEQGRSLMSAAIDSIRNQLSEEKEYTFGKIGIFSLDEINGIHFIPMMSQRRINAELGALPLCLINKEKTTASKVADSSEYPAVEETAKPTIARNGLAEKNLQPDPKLQAGYTMRILSDKNYYIPINKIFAKCAASIVTIATVAVILLAPVRTSAPENIAASMNPVESITAAQESRATAIDIKDSSEAFEEAIKPEAEVCSSPAIGKSYLIVATFHSPQEAQSFIESRRGGSYELTSIKGKNVWRVAAGCGDEATLRALLNSAEFRAAFSEAWIWKS